MDRAKKNASFVPPIPHVDPPSPEALEYLQNMTKKERRQLEKSVSQNKYVQSAQKQRKQHKQELRKEWWWNKGLVILNTILALIAAITGIIALLR